MKSVNPNAQQQVLAVLGYLEEQRGKRVILGQHTQTMVQEELHYIEEVTGELPALCGFELLGYSPNIRPQLSDEECMKEVREARGTLQRAWEWAKRGGLLTFTWHWFSPCGGQDKSFFARNTEYRADCAADPRTEEYRCLLSDMDYMAGLLKPFCDAHIPILWRPFHESDGDWFWWGRYGAEPAKQLYRIMYERYVEHFHLDNLIWVHNSPKAAYYPGDDVVDILTRDLYPPAHQHTDLHQEIAELTAITSADKLTAIGEIGTIPDVAGIIQNKVPCSYYMTWSHEYGGSDRYTSEDVLRRTYQDEHAMTLSRLQTVPLS